MSAGVFGRSSALTWVRVWRLGGLVVGRDVVGCGVVVGLEVGCGGAMLTRQRRAPVCSRSLCKILFPCLSWTSRMFLSRYAEQSSSHSFPRLSKLLVKPGMMWPVRARSDGMVGIARTAAPTDVLVSPVAVRIVVLGAWVLMLMSGAVVVK